MMREGVDYKTGTDILARHSESIDGITNSNAVSVPHLFLLATLDDYLIAVRLSFDRGIDNKTE